MLLDTKDKPSLVSPGGHNEQLYAEMDQTIADLREAFIDRRGYDPDAIWDQAKKPGFRFSEVKQWVLKGQGRRLVEAVGETQLGELVQYGVAKQAVEYYKIRPAIYKLLAEMEESTGFEEVYEPVNRTDIPEEVGENEAPSESRIVGRSVLIRNKRFAKMIAISKQLFEDDKTGRVKKRANQAGDGMVYAEELLWITQVFLAYASTANLDTNGGLVPATNVAGQATLGQTTPQTTAGNISQQGLEDGYTAAGYVTDQLGNFMLVNFDSILVAKSDEIVTEKLLQSFLNPTTPAGVAGAVQGLMAKNVMEGKLTPYASPFVQKARAGLAGGTTRPWALLEKGLGNIFQSRSQMKMVMEDPNSGKSLEENSYRYLVERRMSAGVAEPRFTYWGN